MTAPPYSTGGANRFRSEERVGPSAVRRLAVGFPTGDGAPAGVHSWRVNPVPAEVEGAQRLSASEVEEAALDSLFQRGLELRLYFAPLIFLSAVALLAWDPAPWRMAVIVFAIVFSGSEQQAADVAELGGEERGKARGECAVDHAMVVRQ